MDSITYRWMTETDIPELERLAHRIWHAHYPSIITVQQIDYMLAKSYSPEALKKQLAAQQFLLAFSGGKMVGFVSTGNLADVQDEALRGTRPGHFLHKFYIAPELHGKGVGKGLFNELLMRSPQIKYLRLQVARANINSWNFYRKLGFTIEREFDFAIGEGFVMRDYVMERSIAA